MKEKLNKSQSASLLKNLTDVETNVNYKGNFVEMNVMGKLIQKKDKEISLKSIYELMTTKFEKIENEINLIKQDIKKLDNNLNDVVELNDLKVSKNNKT